jgi:RimJ/RimL family protein N-acetyltransferase
VQLILRDVKDADLPILFEHQREPEAARMASSPSREHDAFMTHWRTKVLGNPSARTKTIVVDGAVAGYVGSWMQDEERVVAYFLGSAYWGRGVATAALASFLADDVRPVHAYVVSSNVGSIRVLAKCGFVKVGAAVTDADGVEEVHMQRV